MSDDVMWLDGDPVNELLELRDRKRAALDALKANPGVWAKIHPDIADDIVDYIRGQDGYDATIHTEGQYGKVTSAVVRYTGWVRPAPVVTTRRWNIRSVLHGR